MSVEVMVLALYHSKASATDKVVLLGIANHHGDGGAWPSLETLARYANVSERQVSRSIKVLEDLGEVKIDHNRGLNAGRNKTNRYWINLSCPPECDGSMNHRIDGKTYLTPRVDISDADGMTDMSGEPVIEPVKKPLNQKSKISEQFTVTQDMLDWINQKGYAINVQQETENFIDHHIAKGSSMVNWVAAWRTWMRNSAKWDKPAHERVKEAEAVLSRQKIETDKEYTRKLLEESQRAREAATPVPKCQHGESILRCRKCPNGLS